MRRIPRITGPSRNYRGHGFGSTGRVAPHPVPPPANPPAQEKGSLMLTATRRAGLALAAGAMLTAPALIAPATADASGLLCRASVWNSSPKQYTDVYVNVRTKPGARVQTVAQYKTSDTTKNARANGNGRANIVYKISRATPGYKVKVDVTVRAGNRTGYCVTSFTPRG